MLYLVSSFRITDEEAVCLRSLQKFMNIIPIISKGDHITQHQIPLIKRKLNLEAEKHGIEWFNCKEVI